MAIGQQADHQAFDQVFLADDDLVDFGEKGPHKRTGALDFFIKGADSGAHGPKCNQPREYRPLKSVFSIAFGPLAAISNSRVGSLFVSLPPGHMMRIVWRRIEEHFRRMALAYLVFVFTLVLTWAWGDYFERLLNEGTKYLPIK